MEDCTQAEKLARCYLTCKHESHQWLCAETIEALCLKDAGVDADSSDFWKSVSDSMESILSETPVRFAYGNSCFSDLIENTPKLTVPHMNEILALGSGDGLAECYIAFKVLGANIVHVTDIHPPHDRVEQLSCVEALKKYTEADALMFIYPFSFASGYDGLLAKFKGRFIVMVGEIEYSGHTNPGDLLEQIDEDFEEVTHVDMRRCTPMYILHEKLIVYRRKE